MADSLKVTQFLAALRRLCAQHQVILAASGYDTLQVWDARAGEETLEFNGIEDCTGIQVAPKDEKDA